MLLFRTPNLFFSDNGSEFNDELFRAPNLFFSDNGSEFNDELFREISQEFINIYISNAAVESPWFNGILEINNMVLLPTPW